MNNQHDQRTARCRRLGHEVTFGYCREEREGKPCSLILDCWWQNFDVRDFLKEHLPRATFEALEKGGRPDKVRSLYDLVQQARDRLDERVDDSVVVDVANNSSSGVVAPDRLETLAQTVARVVLADRGVSPAELSVVFVDDDEMARLNRQARGRHGPTDVLSFSLRDGAPGPAGLDHMLGDVVVSLGRARDQSVEAGHSVEREVALLLTHGLLHLLGEDHEEDKTAAKRMRSAEKVYTERVFEELGI